jgi:hypothetical protein
MIELTEKELQTMVNAICHKEAYISDKLAGGGLNEEITKQFLKEQKTLQKLRAKVAELLD